MSSLLLLASAETPDLSMFDPVSPSAKSIRDLSILVMIITGLIFLVVEAVLCYCLLRFRRSTPGGNEPPQIYGSQPIEIAWSVAPALIVFMLVLITTRTLWEVNTDLPKPRADDRALFVTVVGHQWWWEYIYESHDGRKLGFTTSNELHIPVGDDTARPVYLTLKSSDVCHSFWVPRLAGKTDLIPGRTNHTWFQTARPGLYLGQCAEYCGCQHANMLIRVVAEPIEDFERWLDHQQQPAVVEADLHVAQGAFLSQSCINCHRVRGTTAAGTFGPDLTHLMSRQTLASGMIPNTPENLRAWLVNPQNIKAGCLMPAFGLNKHDLDQIVDYLLVLR
ncbi:MAG: cytochrome c oxidase subunit 2 [Planctomycetaceae bacterium]|nr:cytochrome c oxidase subunit 2 [Planctomycetaceae bacterium]